MATKVQLRSSLLSLVAVVLVFSGCILNDDGTVRTGDLRTETTFLELGDADAVNVNLHMGSGDLEVGSGAADLLEATFNYNVDRWKPVFSYVDEGEYWNLTVRQPEMDLEVEGDTRNEWDLRFASYVPMAMNISIGAGNGDINAGNLNLLSLSASTGAGNMAIDLNGEWYGHLVVRVGTKVGNVNLVVPSYMGVQVSVIQGVGEVVAPGFTLIEGNYKNEAFDTAQWLMLIAVDIGTGDLVILEV